MKNKKLIIGSVSIIFAAFLWALEGVVFQPRLYTLPVSFVVFMLSFIAFAYLNPFLYKEYKYLTKYERYIIIDF